MKDPTSAIASIETDAPQAAIVHTSITGMPIERLVSRIVSHGVICAVLADGKVDLNLYRSATKAGACAVLPSTSIDSGLFERLQQTLAEEEYRQGEMLSVIDRVERVYQTATTKEKQGKVIAGYSLKGGVGKTTLVRFLAHGLQERGLEVVMVDLDFFSPDLAIMEGFTAASPPVHNIAEWDALTGRKLDKQAVKEWIDILEDGVCLLSAPPTLQEAIVLKDETIRYVIDTMRMHFDAVLLDLSPSPNDPATVAGLQLADQILLIAAPELTSIAHILEIQPYFKAMGIHNSKSVALVLNCMPKRSRISFEEIASESPFEVLASLPEDDKLRAAQAVPQPSWEIQHQFGKTGRLFLDRMISRVGLKQSERFTGKKELVKGPADQLN